MVQVGGALGLYIYSVGESRVLPRLGVKIVNATTTGACTALLTMLVFHSSMLARNKRGTRGGKIAPTVDSLAFGFRCIHGRQGSRGQPLTGRCTAQAKLPGPRWTDGEKPVRCPLAGLWGTCGTAPNPQSTMEPLLAKA
jgi:hypothetical protein